MGTGAYRTVLIGRGNVATHLERALVAVGHEVIAVGGRTRTRPIPRDADLYVISVSDRAIAQVAEEIGDVAGLVVHTAGSVPLDVLPQRRRGVLYPLQTFSRGRELNFSSVPLFVESQTDMLLLRQVAESLSKQVVVMDSARRRHLHLAAVFCCNFTNHLYAIAGRMLEEQGVPFDCLWPLIDETAAKVHTLAPRQAQTGPAVRWDTEVMLAQEALLHNPQWREIYRMMSESIHAEEALRHASHDKGEPRKETK